MTPRTLQQWTLAVKKIAPVLRPPPEVEAHYAIPNGPVQVASALVLMTPAGLTTGNFAHERHSHYRNVVLVQTVPAIGSSRFASLAAGWE